MRKKGSVLIIIINISSYREEEGMLDGGVRAPDNVAARCSLTPDINTGAKKS